MLNIYKNDNFYKLLFIIILYFIILSCLSILRFKSYNAGFVDLGRMEQAVWNLAHGRLAINTFELGNAPRLIIHCEPILFLLSPLYLLFQRSEFLLIVQSLILGLAALPLYKICELEIGNSRAAFVLALCFLLHPTLFYINLSDFHPDSFAILFIFSAFYFMLLRCWSWFWVMIVLLLFVREYFGLVTMFFGVYLFLAYQDRKRSLILFALGLAWFIFSFLILPKLFINFPLWSSEIGPLSGATMQFKGLLKNTIALFFPVAFLPFFAPRRLIPALPLIAGAIIAGQFSYANHHAAGILPFIFLASVDVLKSAVDSKLNLMVLLLFLTVIIANQFYGASPVSFRFYSSGDYHFYGHAHNFRFEEHDAVIDEFIKYVGPNDAVSASNHIGGHLARRKYINYFPFPDNLDNLDYILVDLKNSNVPPWLKWEEQIKKVDMLRKNPGFILLREKDSIYLFKRK